MSQSRKHGFHYIQLRTISFRIADLLNLERLCGCLCLLSCVRPYMTPRTIAQQAPLFMGFPRQEYWSGLLFPTPEDLPNPGIPPVSPVAPAVQVDSLASEPSRKPADLIFERLNKDKYIFFKKSFFLTVHLTIAAGKIKLHLTFKFPTHNPETL